jgi:DNA-binding NarL/FixJ family response regulator
MDTTKTRNLITIALVEDRPLVVLGLERVLERDGYRICWKAATLEDATAGMDAELPDVVIIGSRRVLAFAEKVTCISSQTEMLVLVDDAGEALRDQLILAGARGIVELADDEQLVLRAITRVRAGELWIDAAACGAGMALQEMACH